MQLKTNSTSVKLIEPGFLGSCWYGKYHYLEPWIGCEHNCLYCYSRSRIAVNNSLKAINSSFPTTTPHLPETDLLPKIMEEIKAQNVKILKLCRYTDIFAPHGITTGLSYRILETLVKSPVQRIIITTKGLPSPEIADLVIKHKDRFSMNMVIKPECDSILEPHLPPNQERLECAQALISAGVFFTLHMDPLAFSIDLSLKDWQAFLDTLKKYGVTRVMFSYLSIDRTLMSYISQNLSQDSYQTLLNYFDLENDYDFNHIDENKFFMKPEVRKQHIEMFSKLLQKNGFAYVVCGLKSTKGQLGLDKKICHICNGDFYA